MQPDDQSDFLFTLSGVCELYGKTASPQLQALYWQFLQGYSLVDVKRAFQQHAMNPDTGQYMPKPADVVRCIDGSSQTRSAMAWAKVEQSIRLIGGYESVVFDDVLIHAALDGLGDWQKICSTPSDELTFLQSRFEKRYAGFVLNTPTVWPRQFIGQFALDNIPQGYAAPPPIPVGDVERCKRVYKGGSEGGTVQIGHVPVSAPRLSIVGGVPR